MKKLAVAALVALSTSVWSQSSQGAWGLYNYEQREYQIVHNRSEVRSIASITKLFTANTIMRAGLELDERVKVTGKASGRFPKGTMVSRMDLMKAMLISSDNLAAETLAHTYPGGFDRFIYDTNEWVRGWGMTETTIVDASGLLPGNRSSIDDLITFLPKLRVHRDIMTISNERTASLAIPKGKKTVKINLRNTNPTLFQFDNILLSKTGFTNPAGRCVVMLVEKAGDVYAIAILGQRNVQERAVLASDLITASPLPKLPVVEYETIEFKFPL